MADKAEKKAEAPAAPAGAEKKAPAKKGGLLAKTPVLIAGAMVVEAVVLVGAFKMMGGGGPQTAAAAHIGEGEAEAAGEGSHEKGEGKKTDKKAPVEIQVLEIKAPNKQGGRTFVYDVSIYVSTKGEFEERIKKTLEARQALIRDRIRTIIAQGDPEKLGGGSEPGLETLRRQVKYQLDEIVGEGLIDEVLVPRCIPFRTDY